MPTDNCDWLVLMFAGRDIKRVSEILELPEGGSDIGGNECYVDMFGDGEANLQDVPYGGVQYRAELIDEGIPFEGSHSGGGSYLGACFAFMGDAEDPSSCIVDGLDGIPVAEIPENLKPADKVLDEISRYYRLRNKVREYMKINKGKPSYAKEEEKKNG